ncbi:MAG: virginiamycin lyase [Nocardioidaceae bacterium]|nr:virginiamycin lyase [Nocardioidaceae bacterium]
MPTRLLVLVALLALTGACGGSTGTAAAPSTAGPATTSGSLVRTASGPVGMTVDSRGHVWVANADAGTVSRLDASGRRPELSTDVGQAPLRLAGLDGGIWVTVFSDGLLRRLDEETGRVTRTVRTGPEPEGLTTAFGSVWVVLQASAELLRIDPRDGRVTHRYRVGTGPRLVSAGGGALWVSDFETGRLLRVDPGTGMVRRSPVLCEGLQGILVTARRVWATCTTDDALVAVDPRTLRRTSRVPLGGSPDPITAGAGGRILVGLQKGPALAVVDPTSGTVVRRRVLGKVDQLDDRANIDLVRDKARAWLSSYLEGGVYPVTQ